jgi:predicted ribosomally synthesized peptide with SipW-like signal peptide
MRQTNMVNTKLLLGVLMVIGLVGLASGTFAYFQDQSTGTAKITTGNPDLVAVLNSVGNQDFGNIYLPHIVPGDSGVMNLGEIQNQGSAGGDLYVTVPVYNVPSELHLYACDQYGNALTSDDLANGGTIKIGSMAAKANGINAKFPIYMKFVYDETGNPQTGNGVDYNFAVTLSLRTVGTNYGVVDKTNDYYATH